MGVSISYMGTKRELACSIAEVIGQAQQGPMLDAFAGMCSVAEEVAPARQIWTNDIQVFAAEVGRALFVSRSAPLGSVSAADIHHDAYRAHFELLSSKFARSLRAEANLLKSTNFDSFDRRRKTLSKEIANELQCEFDCTHTLFTQTYADTFFGLSQSIEIDAILYAVSKVRSADGTTKDQQRWLTIGLGRALIRIANSTGHFAQFLKPKATSFRRFIAQRKRRLWDEWLGYLDDLNPVGLSSWRKSNKSFNVDSLDLMRRLKRMKQRPSVIYADPPYTDDQYSRYYHVLETLVLYDYPEVTGAGMYRANRFRTPFSIKTESESALQKLVGDASRTGADLVISYPTNGLIYEAGGDPEEILRKSFRSVECCFAIPHAHSTFGASKGVASTRVTEQIFLARS